VNLRTGLDISDSVTAMQRNSVSRSCLQVFCVTLCKLANVLCLKLNFHFISVIWWILA